MPNQAAENGVRIVQEGFIAYRQRFLQITARAPQRFVARDWHAAHTDAVERLNLYAQVVTEVVAALKDTAGAPYLERSTWQVMKSLYTPWAYRCEDFELAFTFFNSITRRMFATQGVDESIEFTTAKIESPPELTLRPVTTRYATDPDLKSALFAILDAYERELPFCNPQGAVERMAVGLETLTSRLGGRPLQAFELLNPVFYRGQGAFLVGRMLSDRAAIPVVIAFRHTVDGIDVDAVLTTDDQVSILFSFTRSYFHVAVDRPYDLVHYLATLMPWKRLAELYIAIGFNKHGKTEFYWDLVRHLEKTDDCFVFAPGQRGMVMIVFTLPSYEVVFKLIRDTFADPKRTTRAEVIQRYDLVFHHDRAGRLVDAQEFEGLRLARSRFEPALLEELLTSAAGSVHVQGDDLVIRHLYIERRLTPLDLYIRQVDDKTAADAVLDYGQAIKDLAAANIFPGDVLLKNFGVTRQGRVVFYDYDELCQVTDCYYRTLPQARSDSDEYESDPWFYVGPHDIFPEEFRTFLGLTGRLREIFLEHHADLFSAAFWRDLKKRHKAGEIVDILPYRRSERLP